MDLDLMGIAKASFPSTVPRLVGSMMDFGCHHHNDVAFLWVASLASGKIIAPRTMITIQSIQYSFAMHVHWGRDNNINSPPFLQTLMVQVWYPMTVCTNSRVQKEIIAKVCVWHAYFMWYYTQLEFYRAHTLHTPCICIIIVLYITYITLLTTYTHTYIILLCVHEQKAHA